MAQRAQVQGTQNNIENHNTNIQEFDKEKLNENTLQMQYIKKKS